VCLRKLTAEKLAAAGDEGVSRLDRILRRDLQRAILPQWLHLEDRMSMRASVEARVPFLDHRIVSFAFSLPDEFKVREGVTKHVLRGAVKDRLPAAIVSSARKQPFRGPDESWMRGPLRKDVWKALIEEKGRLADFVDPAFVRREAEKFLEGQNEPTRFVWTAYNTELWLRHFFG
jgi:asparagine synthase (glutamine-hydrolysing)